MTLTPKGFVELSLSEAEQGAELMWRNILADTVVDMLNRDEHLTREALRDRLIAMLAEDERNRFDKASIQGALKGLDGRMPAL